MSWFQTTNFTSLAKTALKEAQKTIDKALDIHDSSQEHSNTESFKVVEEVEEENVVVDNDDDDEQQQQQQRMTRSSMTIESSIVLSQSSHQDDDDGGGGGFDDDGSIMSSIQEMSSSQYDENTHHEQLDSQDQIISLTDSTIERWSTIEVETIEMSHSRNSSISTIPESNSHSSPERDVAGHNVRKIHVHGQQNSTTTTSTTNVVVVAATNCDVVPRRTPPTNNNGDEEGEEEEKNFVECCHEKLSTVMVPDGGSGGNVIENNNNNDDDQEGMMACNSNSSSSFEHVSSTRLDSSIMNESTNNNNSSNSDNNNSSNKLITKVKTNASSASSSDIEVIPLDQEEQTLAKILQEAETQTAESCFHQTNNHNKRSSSSEVAIQVQIPLQEMKTEEVVSNSASNNKLVTQFEHKMVEKNKEIEQLMEEGQKLSKKQFELSNIVKKLRAKEKETESKIKEMKSELAEKCVEVERLMKSFVHKETVEQSQTQTITKLTTEKRKLESQVDRLTSELEDAQENCNSMKISLENTSLEILETKNIILATQQSAAEVDRLTKEKSELLNRSETLQKQVDHLRTVVHDTQKQSSEREQELKSQLTVVTNQCHRLENDLSDVASDVADATMPLSLEIEKLQQEIQNQNLISSKREIALQSKIADLERKLKQGQDRESSFTDMQQRYHSTVTSLESQVDHLEADCKRLQSALEEEKSTSKMKLMDNCKMLEEMSIEIERLKRVTESVEDELRLEQTERKKYQLLLEQQTTTSSSRNSNITVVQEQSSSATNRNNNNNDNNSAMMTSMNSQKLYSGQQSRNISPSSQSILSEVSYLDEVFDPTGSNARSDLTPKSFFDAFSSVNVIENLHAQLRLRDGELSQYQDEVTKNEKIRKTLNEEIAQLTIQNQEFLMQMEKMNELQSRLDELEQNYNAVLQMYGEKVEEAEELRLDLQDVKDMYRAQIEQLLKR